MVTITERNFIRTFILELALVQKESVFDLDDEESIFLPNSFMTIFDEILSDEVKQARYSKIIPENRVEWKYSVNKELSEFLRANGVKFKYVDKGMRIKLDNSAIGKVLLNKEVSLSEKGTIAMFAEDFLQAQYKVEPKQKKLV